MGALAPLLARDTWPSVARVGDRHGPPCSLSVGVAGLAVPGGGIVYLDTGTVTFDSENNIVFEAGPHQDLNGDVEAFCAALA